MYTLLHNRVRPYLQPHTSLINVNSPPLRLVPTTLYKLQEVGKSLYTGTLACVASANSVTVRKLSLAFDLGAILSHDIHCVCTSISEHFHSKELTKVIPPETRRLMSIAIAGLGTIKGLLIVNTLLPKMSLRISSAALGAYWAIEVSPRMCR